MMNQRYTLASNTKRTMAFVLDDIIVALFVFIIFYDQIVGLTQALPRVMTLESWQGFGLTMNQFLAQHLMTIFMLKVLYHTLLVWQGGKTVGKYIMKISVVAVNGERVTFAQALGRGVVRIVSETFLYLGFILAFFLPLRQTLHDKLSRSVVVEG